MRPTIEAERQDSVTHDLRQMNEPPGARARVALTGPTVAEYFQDAEEAVLRRLHWRRTRSPVQHFESQSSDRIAESEVAEETMSALVKLANDPLEPYDIAQPTAECHLMAWPYKRELVTQRDELRPVQGGEEDTEELVTTSHTEMCEKSEVTSVEEGHDVEFENCAKELQEAKVEELQNTKASLCGSLTKSKEELPSSVSSAERAKVIGSLHQNCDWLLQTFDTRRMAQNGEIVGILKLSFWIQTLTLSCTMRVSLQFERNPVQFKEFKATLEKKGLDRKTNHHGLTETETEELFVVSKAI